jgi:type IV pilus assembly protein PilM
MTGEVDVLLVAAKKDAVEQHLRVVREAGAAAGGGRCDGVRAAKLRRGGAGLRQQRDLRGGQRRRGGLDDQHHRGGDAGPTDATISSGGNLYSEALRGLGLAAEDIERCKRGGEAAGLEIEPRMVQVSEAIAAEIQRSLDFFRTAVAEEPLSRIVLCGGSALVPSLRRALAERSRLPVTLLDPFARVKVDPRRVDLGELRTNAPAAAVAFGLALRAEDDAP